MPNSTSKLRDNFVQFETHHVLQHIQTVIHPCNYILPATAGIAFSQAATLAPKVVTLGHDLDVTIVMMSEM